MDARKYGRTYHFSFSPGVTSDDKIQPDWEQILDHELILTEKLDGENTCLKESGVYARSHVGVTQNPWAANMWPIWERVSHELGTLEIFGENLYGIHSIEYSDLKAYFYVFAIRDGEQWLSWEEVKFYAALLELPTVPVIEQGQFTAQSLQMAIEVHMQAGSRLGGGPTEGHVVRNTQSYSVSDFAQNVLKYVRANHVTTDQHWTRNWKRAKLWYEQVDGGGPPESD